MATKGQVTFGSQWGVTESEAGQETQPTGIISKQARPTHLHCACMVFFLKKKQKILKSTLCLFSFVCRIYLWVKNTRITVFYVKNSPYFCLFLCHRVVDRTRVYVFENKKCENELLTFFGVETMCR